MLKSLDLLADKLTGSDTILQRGNTNASVAAVIGSAGIQGRLYQKKDLSSTILLNRLHPYTQMAAIQTTASMVGVPAKENITNVIIPNTIVGTANNNNNNNNNSNNIPTAGLIMTNTCTDLAIIAAPSIDVTNSSNNNNCNTTATMTAAATFLENNNNNNNNNNYNNNNNNNTSLTNETNNIKNQILSSNDNNNNNSNNNDGRSQIDYNIRDDEYSKEQPDPDTIKMFAGQIPKSMDEGQLKRLFEEYGRVHTINVLRDKITGVSRGCCFVTYYTRKAALRAQDALHNIKTLDGMHHPIQMKPADSENRNERKLFVGMLNKKFNEADVRQLFAGHGVIEECTVLRDQNGQSKGCAFVTFATKQAASAAIKTLDRSRTMEGCSAPLVVKFADTQKEKEQKKLQQIQASLWGIQTGTTNNLTPVTPTAPAVAQAPLAAAPTAAAAIAAATPQILTTANPPQQANPYLATDAISSNSLQLFQQLQSVSLPPTFVQGLNTQPDHNAAMAAAGLLTTPMSMHNLMAIASVNHPAATHMIQAQQIAHHPHHPHHHHHHQSLQPSISAAHLTSATPTLWSSTEALTSAATYTPTAIPQLTNGAAFAAAAAAAAAANAAVLNSPMAAAQAVQAQAHVAQQAAQVLNINAGYVTGRQVEGPEGSNLFIYHLPPEFTDTDLASTFLPFGKVISAKVFIDKNTQKTKGFGFVSYDNPSSAYIAIKAMNGFQIGIRKLKVQLKRSKDSAKPY